MNITRVGVDIAKSAARQTGKYDTDAAIMDAAFDMHIANLG